MQGTARLRCFTIRGIPCLVEAQDTRTYFASIDPHQAPHLPTYRVGPFTTPKEALATLERWLVATGTISA